MISANRLRGILDGDRSRVPSQGLTRAIPERHRADCDLEVVWNGVGPLPGAGSAAGLGSTLSGIHFSVASRVLSPSAIRR
jgi:hypothetical protein